MLIAFANAIVHCLDSGDDDVREEDAVDKNQIRKIDKDKMAAAWDSFLNPTKTEEKKPEKVVVTKKFDFAGETVTVTEEVDADKVKKETKNEEAATLAPTTSPNEATKSKTLSSITGQAKRPAGGLSALVNSLKKPKMSTLTKSQLDWNVYKKSEAIEEELGQHRRSKESFIERQAFLNRTDLREFEREKGLREQERKARNAKPGF